MLLKSMQNHFLLVIPINEINKTDLEFFKTQLLAEKGEHKLMFFQKSFR